MSFSPAITIVDVEDQRAGIHIAAMPYDVIQTQILNRLDGHSLAAISCSSPKLRSLCESDHLWRRICKSTWPSTDNRLVNKAIEDFSGGYRSFFSDVMPAFRDCEIHQLVPPTVAGLISAVDIHFDGELIYSKVLVTETTSSWFLNTPFRIDLFDPKQTVTLTAAPPRVSYTSVGDRLRLSWILINPSKKRAINVASQTPVDVRRRWEGEETVTHLRYSTVETPAARARRKTVQYAVIVISGGEIGQEINLREVKFQMEDMNGKILQGKQSLEILAMAMEAPRRRKKSGESEKEDYEGWMRMKEKIKERESRREKYVDTVIMAVGVTVFLVMWKFFLGRCF